MWFVSLDTLVRSYVVRTMKIHDRKVYIYDTNFMYSNSSLYIITIGLQFSFSSSHYEISLYFLFLKYLLKNTTWGTIQCLSLSCQLNRPFPRFIHVTANAIFCFKGRMVLCIVIYCCVSHCPFYVLIHHTKVSGKIECVLVSLLTELLLLSWIQVSPDEYGLSSTISSVIWMVIAICFWFVCSIRYIHDVVINFVHTNSISRDSVFMHQENDV